jgi:hypothetical protein
VVARALKEVLLASVIQRVRIQTLLRTGLITPPGDVVVLVTGRRTPAAYGTSRVSFCLVVEDGWYVDYSVAVENGVRGVLWRTDFTPARLARLIRLVHEERPTSLPNCRAACSTTCCESSGMCWRRAG